MFNIGPAIVQKKSNEDLVTPGIHHEHLVQGAKKAYEEMIYGTFSQ